MPHTCQHCGKVCLTQRGLTQHIYRNEQCRAKETGANLTQDLQAQRTPPGTPALDARRRSKRTRALNVPERAEPPDSRSAVASGFEGSNFLSDEAHSDPHPTSSDDSEASDNDSVASSTGDEHEHPFGDANTQMLKEFRQFCATHASKFQPLDEPTKTSIKLMQILRQTKAPLNAYQPFMEWHLRETGHLRDETMTLNDTHQYFSRKTLMNRLCQRYNCEALMPKIKKVRLPFSKSVASIPCRDAKDVIVSLLTDPRVKQEDYLFFDDNPLAPPPNPVVHLEDLNTGDAFLKSHERMIKEKGEVLLPVVMYIDGAVTGQFSDLPITALKLALGIHTREARNKEYTWRELGWVPQVRKQRARGKKILKESRHLEAQDMMLVDGEGDSADEANPGPGDEELEDHDEEGQVKAQDFHTILSTILESFVELQRTGFIWDLVYKGKLYKNIKFIIFVPFVKCDTEEADTLCGKYRVRTGNIKQICRYCECPTSKADDPRQTYPYKEQHQIQKLIEKGDLGRLQNLSQQNIRNAWYDVKFHAANARGIHGACPSEMLHAILLGIFKYVRETFFQQLGKTSKLAEDINGLAKMYGALLTRQSDRSLPTTNFTKGTQKGKLMAKECRGVLLVMAAVVTSTKGMNLISLRRKNLGEAGVTDWSRLLEMLLEWEAFLNLKRIPKADVKKLKKKHVFIMYWLRNVARRYEGMGLKIMKFHAIKHLVDDMLLFGTPSETDTGSNESHHKPSKYAARLTQRKEATFNFQTAERMTEFLALDLAICEINDDLCLWEYFGVDPEAPLDDIDPLVAEFLQSQLDDMDDSIPEFREQNLPETEDSWSDDDDDVSSSSELEAENSEAEEEDLEANRANVVTGGTKIRVFEDPDNNGEPTFVMVTRSKKLKNETKWASEVVDFLLRLQSLVEEYVPKGHLPIFTQHKRDQHIFHGHPNFRCMGHWRDWALVDWGAHGTSPCHIWCFVELRDMPKGRHRLEYGGITLKDGVYAVVEYSEYDDPKKSKRITDLFIPLTKDTMGISDDEVTGRRFYLADTEAIVGPCIVIPDIGGKPDAYFQVKPRTQWPNEFLGWLRQPHRDDEMEWTDSEEEREREAMKQQQKEERRKKRAAKKKKTKARAR